MLKMGLPTDNIKQKMEWEGYNPDYLDTPDAPYPGEGGGAAGGGAAAAPPPPAAPAAPAAPPAPPAAAAEGGKVEESTAMVAVPDPEEGAGGDEAAGEDFIKCKDDPNLAKFFKMLKMRVPKPSIQQKMEIEGHDPELLNTPDAETPYG